MRRFGRMCVMCPRLLGHPYTGERYCDCCDPAGRAPRLAPERVLAILAERLEKRATALEGVRMESYNLVISELRHFAAMVRKAREYLLKE